MTDKYILSKSLENYIKLIYLIKKKQKTVRIKDLSSKLGFAPSTIFEAIKNLSDKGYVIHEPYKPIKLTKEGIKVAKNLVKKNQILAKFFKNILCVEKEEAQNNADSLEHAISQEALDKFILFIDFMNKCSCKKPKWLNAYKYYSINGEMKDVCKNCINGCKGKKDTCSCTGDVLQ